MLLYGVFATASATVSHVLCITFLYVLQFAQVSATKSIYTNASKTVHYSVHFQVDQQNLPGLVQVQML
jgi:hypothetical protein